MPYKARKGRNEYVQNLRRAAIWVAGFKILSPTEAFYCAVTSDVEDKAER